MTKSSGCSLNCFFKLLFALIIFGLFIVLPAIAIICSFVNDTPLEFMFTCIGFFFVWLGAGAGFSLLCATKAKCCQKNC